jgi:AraC-like DNA-binding protein
MQFNFSDILFLLVLFLLMFISIFLFTSDKGKRISNILIGSFFLAICLNLADSFLLLKQVYFQYPSWAGWGSCLLLLCGPLIYFYTHSVIYKDFYFTKRKLIHFAPFLVSFSASEIGYLALDHQKQIEILNGIIERRIPDFIYLTSCVIYLHFFTYLFIALRSVKRYELAAANQYSEAQKVTLGWLKTTIWFFLVLMLVSAVNSYLSFQSREQAYFLVLSIMIFLLLLFVIFVLFKALRNPAIFSGWEKKEIDEAIQTAKYASSTVREDEKNRIQEKLQQHMRSAKPYLEPELTLDDLASQLSVKPKTLSQVINELLQQSFFEFINQYRIEEAKRLLTNPKDKKITVLEVMYDVGFNSKSSFNTLFKKHTGLTPSEFKKKSLA